MTKENKLSDESRPIDKEDIKSIIQSVFAMQAISQNIEFKIGESYEFELKFTVRTDHLELKNADISKII